MIRLAAFIIAVIFMLFAAVVLYVAKADAQPMARCSPRAEMVATLSERFGEQPVGVGVISGDIPRVLELFVSKEGSWSMTVTDEDLQSCMQASGIRWQSKMRTDQQEAWQ